MKLAVILAGCIFAAVAIIVLLKDGNWQGFLILGAIGAGFLLYAFKGD